MSQVQELSTQEIDNVCTPKGKSREEINGRKAKKAREARCERGERIERIESRET
jgi:hypothetical protein